MPGESGSSSGKTPPKSEPCKAPPPETSPTSSSSKASPPRTRVCTKPVKTTTATVVATTPTVTPSSAPSQTADLRDLKDLTHDLDKMEDLAEPLSPGGIEKTLDLHIDAQGTNFLDEHDLHDVLTKLPGAFDIFAGPGMELSKNGEFLPSKEEAEELERALAQVSQDVDNFKQSLKQFSQTEGMMLNENDNEDELAKQIADSILQQNLSPTHLDDDLNQDNINDLASSISASDLNNFSQALSSATLGNSNVNHQQQPQHQQLPPNNLQQVAIAGSPLVAQLQRAPQTALQTLQMHRSQNQNASGVIQTQYPGTPLSQGLQIQGLPPGLAAFTLVPQGALIPTGNAQPRALIPEHTAGIQNSGTFNPGDMTVIAPSGQHFSAGTSLNPTITQSVTTPLVSQTLSGPLASSSANTHHVSWGQLTTATSQGPMRFPNRFPIMQQQVQGQQQQAQQSSSGQQQQPQQPVPQSALPQTGTPQLPTGFPSSGLAANLASQGMKLAFPLAGFIQTDLSTVLGPSSSGEQPTQDFSHSLPTQGIPAQQTLNVAKTTVVSSNKKRQPPAST